MKRKTTFAQNFIALNPFKKLAGETAIYGLPSIVGRILNYLLVPIYTRVLFQAEYGTVSVLYSYIGFLLVILTYGMETAFFRFASSSTDKKKVYSTTLFSIFVTSLIFSLFTIIFDEPIASWIDYPEHPEYIRWLGIIVALDAFTSIPFAYLRQLGKAKKFAVVRSVNILINILLNLFFIVLCPQIMNGDNAMLKNLINPIFDSSHLIAYIFISNLISSFLTAVMLLPEIVQGFHKFDFSLWKKLIAFGLPMLVVGLAGNINVNIDKLMLRYLLPTDVAEAQVGIYAACYKISILMTLFIQAYRYAAEPFFFNYAKQKDSKNIYAQLMNYFVVILCCIFLITMLFMDIVILLIGKDFRGGQAVIPILMMANLFLGVYYNLSIWYKLSDKTIYGAYTSIIGAGVTVLVNAIGIPFIGFMASAWAALACYSIMLVLAYFWGRKYYPIDYNVKRFFFYIGLTIILYFISLTYAELQIWMKSILNIILFGTFLVVAVYMEKLPIKKLLHR
ncbi:MAG: oligosaccharide flippase family protein [Bacteroidales bacterium]|nr:oligosaccharide flippase family protein [Bacteroidales bacterium]